MIMMREIATQLYAANRVNDPAMTGLKGLAFGFAFSALARRSPVGAMLIAGAMIARRAIKSGQKSRAERELLEVKAPSRAERIAANGPAARRPIDPASKTAGAQRKSRFATIH